MVDCYRTTFLHCLSKTKILLNMRINNRFRVDGEMEKDGSLLPIASARASALNSSGLF